MSDITAHDDAPTLARIDKSGAAGHLRKTFNAPIVLRDLSGSQDEPLSTPRE